MTSDSSTLTSSRRDFLRRAGVVGAAVYVVPAVQVISMNGLTAASASGVDLPPTEEPTQPPSGGTGPLPPTAEQLLAQAKQEAQAVLDAIVAQEPAALAKVAQEQWKAAEAAVKAVRQSLGRVVARLPGTVALLNAADDVVERARDAFQSLQEVPSELETAQRDLTAAADAAAADRVRTRLVALRQQVAADVAAAAAALGDVRATLAGLGR